jgi:hypothetical protein
MDGTSLDAAARWRHITCDRINQFRRGEFDFDGLLMFFTLLARLNEQGTARLRPPVRDALEKFLAAAAPFAATQPAPPAAAIERELHALHEAVKRQTD